MKLSKLQLAGIALVIVTAMAVVALQLSGHGIISTIDHPPTPPGLVARGITLDHRTTVTSPHSFIVLKWVAAIGVVFIMGPFISSRFHHDPAS